MWSFILRITLSFFDDEHNEKNIKSLKFEMVMDIVGL